MCACSAGHPPSKSCSPNASPAGTANHGVGSTVPIQSNSIWKRLRAHGGALAPCDRMAGRVSASLSSRTARNAAPLGANSHLWQLPVSQAAPTASTSSATWPGACAASTSVSTPSARSARTRRATGNTSPVGLVT
ncbi:MAG: hypothetical protein A2138_16100 [Deltaproteobacteria bacterium RBG_16_71_12]|nr:MAG: hypothetical protein A2138_16100 [Deltaproteobacteria bacterium RBG_16_71_12]